MVLAESKASLLLLLILIILLIIILIIILDKVWRVTRPAPFVSEP